MYRIRCSCHYQLLFMIGKALFSLLRSDSRNDSCKYVIFGTKAVMVKGKMLTRLFSKVKKINLLKDMAVDLVVWVSRLEKRPWSLSIPRSGEALACEWEDEGNHMLRVCDCNNNQCLKVCNLTPKYKCLTVEPLMGPSRGLKTKKSWIFRKVRKALLKIVQH